MKKTDSADLRDFRAKSLIVAAAVLLVFAVALSLSFYEGRLAAPMTHNDVNYFNEGIERLILLRTQGVFALILDFIRGSLHGPISTYQALFAYQVFGVTDWAPYVSNIVYLIIFFGFATYLLRDGPAILLTAAMVCLIVMPLSSNTITEFAPEVPLSLFTAMAVVLMLRLPVFDAPFWDRFIAGLCFGLGLFAHPSAFEFTFVVLFAVVGFVFLRDVVWTGNWDKRQIAIANSLLNILLSLWLPVLYMMWRFGAYWHFIIDSMFDPKQNWIWKTNLGRYQDYIYYLFGPGNEFMFGNRGWVYVGIIAGGMATGWWRNDKLHLARQTELLLPAFLFWLLPTLAPGRGQLFGLPLGFLGAFMTVMALRSIYFAMPARRGAIVVSTLGLCLLVLYRPADQNVQNVPQTAIDREFALSTIDRLKAVLLGNASDYRHANVYMTNIGAYAPNILKYYLMKSDPELSDWTIESKWMDDDPRVHIDFINGSRWDFVIAGQRDNGLTYSYVAGPAEDAVLEAMWQDPTYMAIDHFYGPKGGEVVVFQRRGSFAGWHAVSGIIESIGRPEDPRDIPERQAFLQAFAARPVQADLEIQWAGAITGQKLSIVVNYQKVAELTYDAQTESSSLKQQISLSAGTNDIVLLSDGPVKMDHLVIVPQIGGKPRDEGISIVSATYGANCAAQLGNATRDVAASCKGRIDCTYSIDVKRLGDPANGCGKDFSVFYFCPSEAAMRRRKLPGEASGGILKLSCAPLEKE